MKTYIPKSITRPMPYLIKAEFADGFSATIKLEKFRSECPCAGCKGEEIMGKQVSMPVIPVFSPGLNELKQLTPVGNYAVNPIWGDGHDTGIYSWDYFREVFEKHALSEEDIEKLEQRMNKN